MKKTDQITVMHDFLSKIGVGERQVFENMAIYSLFMAGEGRTPYLTLKEAFVKGVLNVTEKNRGGSVPELKAINKGKRRILLVDGEELQGAKQNRILNTTILLKKESETMIPVSCTESGRWNYTSEKFSESKNLPFLAMRVAKEESVTRSLQQAKTFRSDQVKVWGMIDDFLKESNVSSPTNAMKDAYEKRTHDVTGYLEAFRWIDEQKGFIVEINGKIVGMDYFSSPEAFRQIYTKLLKSYIVEADRQKKKFSEAKEHVSPQQFFDLIEESTATKYKSPGHGYDYRLMGEAITGNSLVYKKEIIHFACFARMSYDNRRNFMPPSLFQD